ncbi:MAG: HNH endonuclease [Planctomycetota bacterium]
MSYSKTFHPRPFSAHFVGASVFARVRDRGAATGNIRATFSTQGGGQDFVVGESSVAYGARAEGAGEGREGIGPADDHGVIEARTVHERLRSLLALGNEVRLEFLDALRSLHDDRLCFELGYSSFHQYCDRELGIAKSTAYEYLKVGKALAVLPGLRGMFASGDLSWDQVRHAARVATPETETAWIELAWELPVGEFLAEVRDALRSGRAAPREKRNGLPNLVTKLSIEVTLEEKERVRAAFALVAEALGEEALGENEPQGDGDARPTLLRWADAVLAGRIPLSTGPEGDAERRTRPAQAIVYHSCRECRAASVRTEDGLVSVEPDRIARLSAAADTVDISTGGVRFGGVPSGGVSIEDISTEEASTGGISTGDASSEEESPAEKEAGTEPLTERLRDAPNSAALSRKVILRDGARCANPACGSKRRLHAHHIIFRARGGRTVLANEVAVCDRCHALIHAGRLEVSGTVDGGLEWRPRPCTDATRLRCARELGERLRSLVGEAHETEVRVDNEAIRDPRPRDPVSTNADTQRVEALAQGLLRLGYRKSEAVARVEHAFARLAEEGSSTDDGEVLRLAMCVGRGA